MRRLLPLSFICALFYTVLISAGCSTGSRAETNTAAAAGRGGTSPAVPVTVDRVVQKPMPVDVEVIGTVEASSVVSMRAQITGELTAVNFNEGDDVREGEVLFALDQRPLEATLRQAEANLRRDEAQAANAAAQAERVRELAARGIATREQVDTSAAASEASAATVGADRAAVENARVQLQYATITAPISGRTGALMVHPGNLVRANDTTPLVVINQISPVNVSFAVPEAQLPQLKKYLSRGGVRVEVQPPGDDAAPASGRITFIDNAVDPTTGTIKVKGSFQNADHHLWPGQFVNVVLTLATDPSALVVPSAAIQTGQNGDYVFVVKPDQTAELRNVKVGRTSGSETILIDGVKDGETVVTDGQLRLVPGSRITVKAPAAGAES
jgi:multidrug efflux system membrane fusion protein